MRSNSARFCRWSTWTIAATSVVFMAVAMAPASLSLKSATTVIRPETESTTTIIRPHVRATTMIIPNETHVLLKVLDSTGHNGYVYGNELYGRNRAQASVVGQATFINNHGVIVQSGYAKAPGAPWPEARTIPVYTANGITVIGSFTIAR